MSHIRWPKYQSFSFSISPSSGYSGLISFRVDWLDLLVVQGTLKSLLQHHNSKASILWCSAFFIVQLSHPYMTTGKTITLTRQIFVGKVMSLLFNKLSRLIIAFLPRTPAPAKNQLEPDGLSAPKMAACMEQPARLLSEADTQGAWPPSAEDERWVNGTSHGRLTLCAPRAQKSALSRTNLWLPQGKE